MRQISVEIRMLEDDLPGVDRKERRALLWVLLGVSPPLLLLMAAAASAGLYWLATALLVLVPFWLIYRWRRIARESRRMRKELKRLDAELAAALQAGREADREDDPEDHTP